MVVTHFGAGALGSGPGFEAGSGDTTDVIDERMHKLIAAEVTRGILDASPVIFGMVKEGIMEIMEERLRSFRAELAAGRWGLELPRSRSSRRVGRWSSSGSGTTLSADVG